MSELKEEVMPCLPTVNGRALELSGSALRAHQFTRNQTARVLSLLAVALPLAISVQATNYIWDGNAPSGSGNNRWTRGSNWGVNGAPPANNIGGLTNFDLIFAGTTKLANRMDQQYYVHSLTFAPSAGSFVVLEQSPVVSLRLGEGGLVNNSTNTQALLVSLVLSNSQTWNAASGDLIIGGDVALGNNTLTFAGAQDFALLNTVQGSGAMVMAGDGNLILTGFGANTFSGGFTVASGTVVVGKNNALGTGPLTLTGGVLDLGSYNLGVSSVSLQGGTINSASGGISSSTTYQVQSGTVNTSLGGSAGLAKTTAGTVTLTSASTYTGNTEIFAGKLTVNNVVGSGTGFGNVWIGPGGLLTGTGSISGMVTNSPGGSFSAGDEVGTLNLGSTIWFGGATNRWDISDATGVAGTDWDLLNINGTLTIDATSADKAVIDIVSFTLAGIPGTATNFDPTQPYSWLMVQTSGGINFAPGESEFTVFELLMGNFINPTSGGQFGVSLSPDGNDLYLTFMPVPEPSKPVLFGLGLCGWIYARRFKGNWGSSRR